MKIKRILSAVIAVVLMLSCIGTVTLAADAKPEELVNSLYTLKNNRIFKVGYIGGSVTAGTGLEGENLPVNDYSWRGLTRQWLENTFKNNAIIEVSSAYGGTGSLYGAYRIDSHINKDKAPDLLFIEMSINDQYDGIYNKDENYVYIETMVRKVYESNPYTNIVFIITGANAQLVMDAVSPEPVWGEPYTKIAEHYDIPVIYVGRELVRKIYAENGNSYPDQAAPVWKKYFSDMVHPKAAGYQEYANTIISFLEKNLVTNYTPTESDRIDYTKAENYDTIYCAENGKDNGVISVDKLLDATLVRTDGEGFLKNVGSFWRTSQAGHSALASEANSGSTASFTFNSSNIGIWAYVFGGGNYPGGTKVHYKIDDGEEQTIDLPGTSLTNKIITLATDLDPNVEHTIRIEHDKDTPNPFRIFYFLLWDIKDGEEAKVASVPYYKFTGDYSVTLDGMEFSDFKSGTTKYEIPVGTDGKYPVLSFAVKNFYGYKITQADKDGVAKLKIDNGKEYTFKFVKKELSDNVTVKFETNGGGKIADQTIKAGATAAIPTAPTKSGYTFDGWYKDAVFTERFFGTTAVNYNTIVYARWLAPDEVAQRMVLTIDKKDAVVFGKAATNDVAPIIRNSRTMLPARFVAENLGATVEWDNDERKVTIKNDTTEILIYIDSDTAKVNGKDVKLDSPAFIENDRTYTPVRFIVENLGAKIEWKEDEREVVIIK